MTSQEIHARLQERFGPAILTFNEASKDPFVVVDAARIHEIALFLRDDPALRFDFLMCHSGVDYPPASIAVVLHLFSYSLRHTFVVKALVDRAHAEIDSVQDVWPTANWHERECFDLLGVVFRNHPDLRRIMLPDDWPGHPLRRDWKEPSHYQGIPTTRPDQLELVHLGGKLSLPAEPPAEAPSASAAPASAPSAPGTEVRP